MRSPLRSAILELFTNGILEMALFNSGIVAIGPETMETVHDFGSGCMLTQFEMDHWNEGCEEDDQQEKNNNVLPKEEIKEVQPNKNIL
ncbi:hypothetical protein ACP4OV_006251 [Aristida adscensionis]